MRPPWRPCVCCVYAYYYYCILMPVGGGAPVSLSDGRSITYRYLKVYRPHRALPSPSKTPPPLIFTPPNSKRGTLTNIYYVMCNVMYIYVHIYVRLPLTPAIWAFLCRTAPPRSPPHHPPFLFTVLSLFHGFHRHRRLFPYHPPHPLR